MPRPGIGLKKKVIDYLKAHPEEKFTARQLAEWVVATYPADCQKKKSGGSYTDTEFLNQLVAEIGQCRQYADVKTTEGRPRKFYYTLMSDSTEVAAVEVESSAGASALDAEQPKKLNEHDLYPLLSQYLLDEFGMYSRRIDEKCSSNTRGANGNRWLYPDIVGMEDLGADWHLEVRNCVIQHFDKRTKLWSFEVKPLIFS
ncbi:MAG: hypothetical protein LBF51_05555 [Zoogloeaceae bacterium]|jgi:hypothetical protein|nr:hypothetical protein [Zoogloeaceae bacterium]